MTALSGEKTLAELGSSWAHRKYLIYERRE
jgi:hypothetical protein